MRCESARVCRRIGKRDCKAKRATRLAIAAKHPGLPASLPIRKSPGTPAGPGPRPAGIPESAIDKQIKPRVIDESQPYLCNRFGRLVYDATAARQRAL